MTAHAISTPSGTRKLFGIPLADFGLFASLLMAFAVGLMSFCIACFFSIFGILIYDEGFGHNVNFADSYRYIALPVGVAVLVLSLIVLLGSWARRKLTGR